MTPAELAEIAHYAKEFNQRFGQFIDNAVVCADSQVKLYYMTDEQLIGACRWYYRKYRAV